MRETGDGWSLLRFKTKPVSQESIRRGKGETERVGERQRELERDGEIDQVCCRVRLMYRENTASGIIVFWRLPQRF